MIKIVFLSALAALVVAEPPSNYGAPQQAYAYSAPASSGYSDFGYSNDGDSYVDDALLARVAQIIQQNEGSYSRSSGYSSGGGGYSAPSSSYGAPSYSSPSSSYGAPTRSISSGIRLGRPEIAQRVAEFDLSGGYSGGYSSGGRSQGGYN